MVAVKSGQEATKNKLKIFKFTQNVSGDPLYKYRREPSTPRGWQVQIYILNNQGAFRGEPLHSRSRPFDFFFIYSKILRTLKKIGDNYN